MCGYTAPALVRGTHTVHARRTTMTAQLPLAPSLGAPALPHDDAGSTLAPVVSVLAATLGLLLAWLLKTRLDRLEARLLDARTSAKDQGGSAGGVLALAVPPPSSRNTIYGRTTAEQAAGVSPTDFSYPPGDCRRFGYDPSGRVDSTAAINTALRVPGEAFLSEGVAKVSAPIRLRSNSTLAGVASGPYNEHDPVRGSQIRPTAAFQGAAVVVLDPATEGAGGAYINGVGLRRFCIDMTAVARRGLIGIQVLSAADPAVFLDLKVMNLDAGNFVYVGQSANPTALQSEGIVFDNLLCLSFGIDPPNADPGVIVEASNEVHFKNGKVDRRSNGKHFAGSVGMLVRPSAKGVTVNAMTSSQMSYAGWETGKKVTSSALRGKAHAGSERTTAHSKGRATASLCLERRGGRPSSALQLATGSRPRAGTSRLCCTWATTAATAPLSKMRSLATIRSEPSQSTQSMRLPNRRETQSEHRLTRVCVTWA